MNKAFAICTVINGKLHYVSEIVKIFTGQIAPGLSRNVKEAIMFETKHEAQATVDKIRDVHNRKYMIETVQTESKKTFAAYNRAQKQQELN